MNNLSRYATIDIGSNSLRFLAVESCADSLYYLDSGIWTVRLAEGMGRGKYEIKEKALERTMAALEEVCHRLDRLSVSLKRRLLFTTESFRSSLNVSDAKGFIEERAGLKVRILEGWEEAFYSFKGALLGTGLSDPLVFDLGGGSLEISDGKEGFSLPMGALRVKNLFGEDEEAIKGYVRSGLKGLFEKPSRRESAKSFIGVGGTSSAAVMILKKIAVNSYHPSKVHGSMVKVDDIRDLILALKNMKPEERKSVAGLEPSRSDIIVSGLCVIEALLEFFGASCYFHSECDLLWGLAAEMVESREAKKLYDVVWRCE